MPLTVYPPFQNTTTAEWMRPLLALLATVVLWMMSSEHTDQVRQLLQRCAEKHITLNIVKWKFAKPQVDFAGFAVAGDGYHIDQSIMEVIIAKFPTPTTRTDF